MTETQYDVLVIGGGPGGYVCAIRCAQLGLKTACVEQWLDLSGKPVLGGTCLIVGCIPSKALLDSSHHYAFIRHEAAEHGIQVNEASMDVAKMLARKDKVVKTLTSGVAGLFTKHKIDWLQGHGRLLGGNQVDVTPTAKTDAPASVVSGRYIVIATGSKPAALSIAPVDQETIVDSTGALDFPEVPAKLGVIGAGVIGLELGSVWRRLGSEVVILEALPEFLPAADAQISKEAYKILIKQGLNIRLDTKVTGANIKDGKVTVQFSSKGAAEEAIFDKLIVAVGRKPQTEGLGAQEAGLQLDERGFIAVDAESRTHLPNVYAIGDCVLGPMLAHKAFEEGASVAEQIAGQSCRIDHDLVPWVIYTWPEIAWVGKTEQELKSAGIEYRVGTFPFLANGRAKGMGDTAGLVKILGDAKTDRILGAHILGPNASELIAEIVVAMSFEGATEDLALTIHAHPTLSEAVHEAALAVDGRPLHI